ncbi:DUF1566 domain-containing protein [Trinickia symbiotica]|uniref:DUF1566 domain-containing protein n=1 Tax=Trinickia symbiotica TaxID=863227 RepID=UPI0011B1CCE3|nr:DUF1566 domain-containing protein [Trinickia symbiotica]
MAAPPAIGEYWPGEGGVYAGIMPDYIGRNPQHVIFSIDEAVGVTWGAYGVSERGATSDHDGAANTRALVASRYAHPAAEWADHYEKDRKTDFHLPSRQEWDVAVATIREQFAANAWYWSSTERSDTMAWGHNFNGFDFEYLHKTFPGRARAVRTLPA